MKKIANQIVENPITGLPMRVSYPRDYLAEEKAADAACPKCGHSEVKVAAFHRDMTTADVLRMFLNNGFPAQGDEKGTLKPVASSERVRIFDLFRVLKRFQLHDEEASQVKKQMPTIDVDSSDYEFLKREVPARAPIMWRDPFAKAYEEALLRLVPEAEEKSGANGGEPKNRVEAVVKET